MNKQFEIPDFSFDVKTVNVGDASIDVPAHHDWVTAVAVKLGIGIKYFLVSYAEKPTQSPAGTYIPVEGTETHFVAEIAGMPEGDTLTYVGPMPAESNDVHKEECVRVLNCTKALIGALTNILVNKESTDEEKAHAIFCNEHGIISQFIDDVNGDLEVQQKNPLLDLIRQFGQQSGKPS